MHERRTEPYWLMALAGVSLLSATACSDAPVGSPSLTSGGASSGGSGTVSGGASGASSGGAPGAGSGGQSTSTGGVAGNTGSGGSAGGVAGSAGAGGTPNYDRSPEGTCARWNADHADTSEGTWSGSLEPTCDPGDISADGRANALKLLNLMRWLADLPAVQTDPMRNQLAQACALIMHAQGDLSHNPPQSWPCWSQEGRDGAATSNISGGPGVQSINAYMIDGGNETTFGHRRIILGNSFGPVGLGSTGEDGASCMQNNNGTGAAGKQWVAWPPPGAFPLQAYAGRFGDSLGDTGWHVQGEDIEFGGAEVTITSGGSMMPVSVSELDGSYGNNNAIRIAPDGWEAEAGATYSVSVTGITPTIAYDVQIVDCE